MQRSRIASAVVSILVLLPSCSLLIDTNPDGIIVKKGTAGQAGDDAGGNSGKGGSGDAGGMGSNGGVAGAGTVASAGAAANGIAGSNPGAAGASASGAGGVTTLGGSSGVSGAAGATLTGGASGMENGGAATAGGNMAIGGSANSGGNAAGGAAVGGAATGGFPSAAGTSAAGSTGVAGAPLVCTGTMTQCGGNCVDTTTDKANCGLCGAACESYQFCANGTCLPQYKSTRVLPSAFTTVSDAPTLRAAAVDNTQGDLVLQMTVGSAAVTFSPPGASLTVSVSASDAIARYTASGTLVWARDVQNLFYRASDTWTYDVGSLGNFALASNGDFAVAYRKTPPSSPGGVIPYYRLGRFTASNATFLWEAQFDLQSSPSLFVVNRPARNDFLAFGMLHDYIYQAADQAASVAHVGVFYGAGAAVGADGSTLWMWSGGNGAYYWTNCALNPWSASVWDIPSNPAIPQGVDAYIIGAQDNGQSIGPWFTEGDWGPDLQVAVDTAGDLIVVASSGGLTRFNGGQALLDDAGQVLFKVNRTTGIVMWKTLIPAKVATVAIAPGGRIVTMVQTTAPLSTPPSPYLLNIYSGIDGSLLTSFTTGLTASLVATGTTDMFVLGLAPSAADFNPGTATDTQGSTPGAFISRYSF